VRDVSASNTIYQPQKIIKPGDTGRWPANCLLEGIIPGENIAGKYEQAIQGHYALYHRECNI
jgi:hypothetical protein